MALFGKKKKEAVSHKINKNDLYFHYNEFQCGFIFILCRIENSKHFQFQDSHLSSILANISTDISSYTASSPLLSPGHTDCISQPCLPLDAST